MTRGGSRPGAGRPPKDASEKARPAAFKLPPGLIEKIRDEAARRGISQSELLARAVSCYVAANPHETEEA